MIPRLLFLTAVCLAPAACQRGPSDEEARKLMELLEIQPSHRVAEIGFGEGKMTLLAARAADRVYATEVDEKHIADLEKRKPANVTIVRGAEAATNLPQGCCEVVFLRNVYHHFDRPEEMARDIFRTVKPGGRLVVVDFPGRGSDTGHGVEAQAVVEHVTSAGFQHQQTIPDFSRRGFAVVFHKPNP